MRRPIYLLPILLLLQVPHRVQSLTPTCLSHPLKTFSIPLSPSEELPSLPLSPPLSLPSLTSSLTPFNRSTFLTVTHRGPTRPCATSTLRDPVISFPAADFSPTLAVFRPDPDTSYLRFTTFLPLVDNAGSPVSGLPNSPRDPRPFDANCATPLPYDPRGLDPEGLALLPDESFVVIVEEYAPSILLVDARTGRIITRYVPGGLESLYQDLGYNVEPELPSVLAQRKKGKGFEAVVVDLENGVVVAIMQDGLGGKWAGDGNGEGVGVVRCIVMRILDGGAGGLRYERSFVIEGADARGYTMEGGNGAMGFSAASYVQGGKFAVLERMEGQAKMFLVDWSSATDLKEGGFEDDDRLEDWTWGQGRRVQDIGVLPAEKVLVWDGTQGIGGGNVPFEDGSRLEGLALDMEEEDVAWLLQGNQFANGGRGDVTVTKVKLGRSVRGASVCSMPEHAPTPVIDVEATGAIRLVNSSTTRVSSTVDGGAAENLDVEETLKRAYVANGESNTVDMYDLSSMPAKFLDSLSELEGFEPTSTSVCTERDAVAVGYASTEGDDVAGRIEVVTKDLKQLRTIRAEGCFLVDHVKWSKNCDFLVAACEGEGAEVPGGVLVADFGGKRGRIFRGAKVAGFSRFDDLSELLRENGVGMVESGIPSMDFEPEYVTIIGNHAFVTLQENNAIAVVDLLEAQVTEVKPIGFIDRSRPGFGLDASDKDGMINIRNYDFLYGMPQPDTISHYVAADGDTYLVYANEGDAKDSEEARGEDITDPDELGRFVVEGLKEAVEDKTLLGRLKFSSALGFNEDTNTQEKMFHFGSRSFSIMALNGTIVFDSGEWFARIQERYFPEIFNANGFESDDLSESQADQFDKRSDDKGGEPESLSLMNLDGTTYALIGLERSSIIVVFDISDPLSPTFVDAVHNHPVNEPTDLLFATGRQGDLDPEGLFASGTLKKLFVSGSVSNTVTTYDIAQS